MKTELCVRKAVPADCQPASELIYLSMGRFGDSALGFDDHALTMRVLRGFFQLNKNRFSHDVSWLVERDDQVAGVLVAFPGREYLNRELIMGRQAFRIYGVLATIHLVFRSFALAVGKETEKDELYISHLATHPDHRRQGVGIKLLDQAEKLMRVSGLKKCSLIVELDNINAQALYSKTGFQITQKVESPRFEKKFHTRGYFRMVKTFA